MFQASQRSPVKMKWRATSVRAPGWGQSCFRRAWGQVDSAFQSNRQAEPARDLEDWLAVSDEVSHASRIPPSGEGITRTRFRYQVDGNVKGKRVMGERADKARVRRDGRRRRAAISARHCWMPSR